VDKVIHQTEREAFQSIVGEKLSAVTFILDYWQLQFDGPMINVMSRIDVHNDGVATRDGDFGFRDRLCGQIAKIVANVDLSKDRLTIEFEDHSTIAISIRDEDLHGPEAIVLFDYDGRLRIVI
jgi:hypothetical protein